jgi:predicted nucleotidyltransferase
VNAQPEPPTLDEIARRLTPALAAAGVVRAIVFGSHARREADAWSDLDLVVVTQTVLPFVDRFRTLSALFEVSPRPLELLVYTPEEFSRMVETENPFIQQVLKDGVTIYER